MSQTIALRSELIRTAFENPGMRDKILPVIDQFDREVIDKAASLIYRSLMSIKTPKVASVPQDPSVWERVLNKVVSGIPAGLRSGLTSNLRPYYDKLLEQGEGLLLDGRDFGVGLAKALLPIAKSIGRVVLIAGETALLGISGIPTLLIKGVIAAIKRIPYAKIWGLLVQAASNIGSMIATLGRSIGGWIASWFTGDVDKVPVDMSPARVAALRTSSIMAVTMGFGSVLVILGGMFMTGAVSMGAMPAVMLGVSLGLIPGTTALVQHFKYKR